MIYVKTYFCAIFQETNSIFTGLFFLSNYLLINMIILNFFIVFMNEAYSALTIEQKSLKRPSTKTYISWIILGDYRKLVDEEDVYIVEKRHDGDDVIRIDSDPDIRMQQDDYFCLWCEKVPYLHIYPIRCQSNLFLTQSCFPGSNL